MQSDTEASNAAVRAFSLSSNWRTLSIFLVSKAPRSCRTNMNANMNAATTGSITECCVIKARHAKLNSFLN